MKTVDEFIKESIEKSKIGGMTVLVSKDIPDNVIWLSAENLFNQNAYTLDGKVFQGFPPKKEEKR